MVTHSNSAFVKYSKDFLKRIIVLAGALQHFCVLKETHKKFHHLLQRIKLVINLFQVEVIMLCLLITAIKYGKN